MIEHELMIYWREVDRAFTMDSFKSYYDELGKTLTVWFDDPAHEAFAEETEEEVILIKNQAETVIGFECLSGCFKSRLGSKKAPSVISCT